MGVAKTGSKLTVNDATALTRVGGLISQQAGVSFERVMTNIQQLMVQSNPNIRDIRELLNQAPILGRYAIDEMERKGITGVDKNTYLKDQNNLLSVLTRYDVENASSPGPGCCNGRTAGLLRETRRKYELAYRSRKRG